MRESEKEGEGGRKWNRGKEREGGKGERGRERE